MVANAPGSLEKFFLVTRRFLLGAPKLRVMSASGSSLDSYELDMVKVPPEPPQYPPRRRRGRWGDPSNMVTSSLLHHSMSQSTRLPPLPPPTPSIAEIEPYQLETVYYDPTEGNGNKHSSKQVVSSDPSRPPPVPYWYDSPHFRPVA